MSVVTNKTRWVAAEILDKSDSFINPATEDTLQQVRDKFTPVYSQLIGADETTAQSITLDTGHRKLLEVYATADASTTFHLDVSNDNTNWINDYYTWSAVTSVKGTYWNGFRYVRLRSDAAGVSGNKVSLYLAAKP